MIRKLRRLWYRLLGEQMILQGIAMKSCREHYPIDGTFVRYDDNTVYRITRHVPDRLANDPGIFYAEPCWCMLYEVWGYPLLYKGQLTEKELLVWTDD